MRKRVDFWWDQIGWLLLILTRIAIAPIFVLSVPFAVADAADRPSPDRLMDRGTAAYRGGQTEAAIQLWSDAEKAFDDANDNAGRYNALLRRAEAYQQLGLSDRSIADLETCRSLSSSGVPAGQSLAAAELYSRVLSGRGRYNAAVEVLIRAIDEAKQRDQTAGLAAAYVEMGNVLYAQGRWTESRESYQSGFAYAGESHATEIAAAAAVNIARTYLATGEPAKARDHTRQGAAYFDALTPGWTRENIMLALSDVLLETCEKSEPARIDPPDARGVYERLSDVSRWAEGSGDRRTLSYALGYMSRLYRCSGKTAEAVSLAQEARRLAKQLDDAVLEYRWDVQIGRLLASTGDRDDAIQAYQRASQAAQTLRTDVKGRLSPRQGFSDLGYESSAELVDLLLQRAGEADEAAAQADLRRVRSVVEARKQAELEDYFGDPCLVALEQKKVSLDDLTSEAAVLYPIVLRERTELLLTTGGYIHRVTVKVRDEQIIHEVRLLRQRLERATTRQFLPHAQTVYDWLIRPLEDVLRSRGTRTLVVVPDAVLRNIPFGALHDGEHFLVEKIATAIVPGLDLTDVRPNSTIKKKDILIAALLTGGSGYPQLPAVADEVAAIETSLSADTLLNDNFTVDAFERALAIRPYTYVHIASHGVLTDDPASSFLVAADGKLTLDRLQAAINKSEFRSEPVELLTLSACSTAAGDDRAALGLAGIGLKAGARSVLASLWSVDDRAAAALISRFYEALFTSSTTKAESLQKAKEMMIANPRYSHPAYWASFILIGNWL